MFEKSLLIKTKEGFGFRNITDTIEFFVEGSGVDFGSCHIWSVHTTCALIIEENQEALMNDYLSLFRTIKSIGEKNGHMHTNTDKTTRRVAGFCHDCKDCSDCERRNAAAHIISSLLGKQKILQISGGKLTLGKYQNVIFIDFDGGQERFLNIQIYGYDETSRILHLL